MITRTLAAELQEHYKRLTAPYKSQRDVELRQRERAKKGRS